MQNADKKINTESITTTTQCLFEFEVLFFSVGVDTDQDNSVSVLQQKTIQGHCSIVSLNHVALLSVCVCVQIGPDGVERRSTKQESVWLFRIWYNFDHKYPLAVIS